MKKLILFVSAIQMLFASTAWAGERTKSIDFDDEVVEGVNKKAYDSLSQVSENGRDRNKSHLYRKRGEFRPETEETLREIKVWQ